MPGTATPHRNKRVDQSRDADTQSFAEKAAIYATRPIRTEDEYDHAQQIIRQLLREPHPEGSFAYDVLEVLAILLQDYEEKNVPELPNATPQEIVQFISEQRGITQGDLAEILGGRSRLSEFLNGKRALSIGQVKSLREQFGIPADLLIA
jgi:HTH-type transcriptional regulator/antitoxin HigA